MTGNNEWEPDIKWLLKLCTQNGEWLGDFDRNWVFHCQDRVWFRSIVLRLIGLILRLLRTMYPHYNKSNDELRLFLRKIGKTAKITTSAKFLMVLRPYNHHLWSKRTLATVLSSGFVSDSTRNYFLSFWKHIYIGSKCWKFLKVGQKLQ